MNINSIVLDSQALMYISQSASKVKENVLDANELIRSMEDYDGWHCAEKQVLAENVEALKKYSNDLAALFTDFSSLVKMISTTVDEVISDDERRYSALSDTLASSYSALNVPTSGTVVCGSNTSNLSNEVLSVTTNKDVMNYAATSSSPISIVSFSDVVSVKESEL